MTETVGRERDTLEQRVVVLEVCAELGTALVIDSVKLQAEMAEALVDFEGLSDITTSLIVNVVVREVQMSEDL